eukprot:gene3327-44927_t
MPIRAYAKLYIKSGKSGLAQVTPGVFVAALDLDRTRAGG